ncbi:lipoprotein-releasing ABC transporter permease subunit [Psychrobium sp. MM17-31]|uniref:lipoprotein-releasing ABC transporter permease subunit n=1 Tax=Psychrobium sp. MM17-31 TaxID=2917758 RepID=UPI001EF4B745|nr:lipoprotein-releasing ABC transporter permease subunit [Psychrobium sp. MM17-31]MCG7531664.1 lipoprotein-releasing ABC transporter permease subunit [Psychrobium sp. MM17-31]
MNLTPYLIAWRFARARGGSRFLNFITLFSIGGILLGVAALIIVLSVMNGFESQLKDRILGAVPHIVIKDVPKEQISLLKLPSQVIEVTPLSMSQAMIQGDSELSAVMLQGIDPNQDSKVNLLASNMRYGAFDSLESGKYRIILGRILARQLNVTVGDKIRVISAQKSVFTPFGRMPSQRNFTISGVFEMQSQADSSIALVHIDDAKRLLRQRTADVSDYRLFLSNAFDDAPVSSKLAQNIELEKISTWREQYGELFSAVRMEKNMLWMMLSLIIAVAAFNIISALVILVTEKQTDIAILSTLGLSRTRIAMIFIAQGTLNGFVGTVLGTIIGLLLTFNLNDILHALNLNIVANPIDPTGGLPIVVDFQQVAILVVATVVVTLVSTLYPSYKAGAVEPAKALKHE